MKALAAGLLLLLLILPGSSAGGQPDSAAEAVPHLRVRGEAEIQVPADHLRVSIGMVSRADSARLALERNSEAMKKVEEVLLRLGLDQQEYRTGHFSLQPRWSRSPAPDRQPEIIGFTAAGSFAVATTRLELAGPLIEAAARAGANSIGDLIFGLADPQAHRAEAIRLATGRARAEALVLAAAAGVSLEEIIALQLDQTAVNPQRFELARMEAVSGEPPLAPGEVAVHAGVAITYRIDPIHRP